MRFNKPYRRYEFKCCLCGTFIEIETLNETEDSQADFLREAEQKCFDCLEAELFGFTKMANRINNNWVNTVNFLY